jgi:hypothetical protein
MMQVSGGPPGEWSTLIVGHQWPSEMTIAGLSTWIQNREQIANAHLNIADLLNGAKPDHSPCRRARPPMPSFNSSTRVNNSPGT